MPGIKIRQVEKTGKMKFRLDKKVDSPSDLLKAIAGLKSKLFITKKSRAHLQKHNQNLQSSLTSINDQQVKLLQKLEEAEAFKQQAEAENAKLRHLMAVSINHREVEFESLLAAERAHSRELEIAMTAMAAAPQATQMPTRTRLTYEKRKTEKKRLKSDLCKAKQRLREVTGQWQKERTALLEELKTAQVPAGNHQQTAAAPEIEDKVVEARESQPRRKKNIVTIVLTLEEDPEKHRRRCEELEASLLHAAECSRQALQDKEQEHLAELELLRREKQTLAATATNAERLLALRNAEWQEEKAVFLLLEEMNRESLKDEQEFLVKLQSEVKEKLEQQLEVKAIEWREKKALLFLANNLDEKALQEKELELETVTDQMTTRQNRRWYQRLLLRWGFLKAQT